MLGFSLRTAFVMICQGIAAVALCQHISGQRGHVAIICNSPLGTQMSHKVVLARLCCQTWFQAED